MPQNETQVSKIMGWFFLYIHPLCYGREKKVFFKGAQL